jgi:hypothetical protein
VTEQQPTDLCLSRGPRIGDDGHPVCKLPAGHEDASHRPAPEDGWGNLSWRDVTGSRW